MVDSPDRFRLSDEELDALFAADIEPRVFLHRRPNVTPVIVFLGGQPAAGKTKALESTLARHTNMAEVVGDSFRKFHPDYDDLMETDPLVVADATAQASGAWVKRSLNYAYEHGYSVLVEGTFRNPQMTLNEIERFSKKGFRTEVVALATREDRSRLDSVSRYLDLQNSEPRWVANSHHDLAYEKAPETVQACEDSPYLDRISVTNRAGADLFSNERNSDGQWSRPPGAAEAMHRERAIPPDQDEARGWLSDYQRHCRATVDRGELNSTTLSTFTALHSDADRNADLAYSGPDDAGSLHEHTQRQRVQHRVLESAASGASPESLREERSRAERDIGVTDQESEREPESPVEARRTPDGVSAAEDHHEATAVPPEKNDQDEPGLDEKIQRIRAANEALRVDRGEVEKTTEPGSVDRDDSLEQGEGEHDQEKEPELRDSERRLHDLPGRENDGIER